MGSQEEEAPCPWRRLRSAAGPPSSGRRDLSDFLRSPYPTSPNEATLRRIRMPMERNRAINIACLFIPRGHPRNSAFVVGQWRIGNPFCVADERGDRDSPLGGSLLPALEECHAVFGQHVRISCLKLAAYRLAACHRHLAWVSRCLGFRSALPGIAARVFCSLVLALALPHTIPPRLCPLLNPTSTSFGQVRRRRFPRAIEICLKCTHLALPGAEVLVASYVIAKRPDRWALSLQVIVFAPYCT